MKITFCKFVFFADVYNQGKKEMDNGLSKWGMRWGDWGRKNHGPYSREKEKVGMILY